MAHRNAQEAQHAPSVHGTRSTTRSTTSKPHPALTSRPVTAFRSRSVSAGQSRTPMPENAPARTPGDHSERVPTARSARRKGESSRCSASPETDILRAGSWSWLHRCGRPHVVSSAAGTRIRALETLGTLSDKVVTAGVSRPRRRSINETFGDIHWPAKGSRVTTTTRPRTARPVHAGPDAIQSGRSPRRAAG